MPELAVLNYDLHAEAFSEGVYDLLKNNMDHTIMYENVSENFRILSESS